MGVSKIKYSVQLAVCMLLMCLSFMCFSKGEEIPIDQLELIDNLQLQKKAVIEEYGISSVEYVKITTDIGRYYLRFKLFDKALEQLDKIEFNNKSRYSYQLTTELISSKSVLAGVHLGARNFNLSEKILDELIVLLAKEQRELTLDAAYVYRIYADLNREIGFFEKAEKFANRCIKIRENNSNANKVELAVCYDTLGKIFWHKGNHREARRMAIKALGMMDVEDSRYLPEISTILNNFATANVELGLFSQAIDQHLQAKEIREKIYGLNHYDVSLSLNNLGNAYRETGQYKKAEKSLRDSLRIREAATSSDSPRLVAPLNNIALTFVEMGRYEEAEQFYRKAIALLGEVENPGKKGLGQVLTNFAKLRINQKRFIEAKDSLSEALKVSRAALGNEHHEVATGLNFLALAYAELGRESDALTTLDESLRIREKILGVNHPHTLLTNNRRAKILISLNRSKEAEGILRNSLQIQIEELGSHHPNVAATSYQLGVLLLNSERIEEAHHFLSKSMSIQTDNFNIVSQSDGGQESDVYDTNIYMSVVKSSWLFRKDVDHPARRKELVELAFEASQRANLSVSGSALTQMSLRNSLSEQRLSEVIRDIQDLQIEWRVLDKQAISYLSLIDSQTEKDELSKIRTRMKVIESKLNQSELEIRTRFPKFSSYLRSKPLRISEVQEHIKPDEVLIKFSMTIDDNGVSSDEVFAWAITKDEVSWKQISINGDELAGYIEGIRCGLDKSNWYLPSIEESDTLREKEQKEQQRNRVNRCQQLLGVSYSSLDLKNGVPLPFDLDRAFKLYITLFGNFEEIMMNKQLLYVPSGLLSTIPLQVLITKKPDKLTPARFKYSRANWLIRNTSISVLPTISNLKSLRRYTNLTQAKKPYLGIGNPILNGPNDTYADLAKQAIENQFCDNIDDAPLISNANRDVRSSLSSLYRGGDGDIEELRRQTPLPETSIELCEVAKTFGANDDDVWLGARANEQRLNLFNRDQRLASYNVLHFATHGFIAGDVGGLIEPALLLTPPAEPNVQNDGLLKASEISKLKLNAEWVVLSACNTAGSGKESAVALSGLARSFFYAGSKSLLVSHWEVYSKAAVDLITVAFQNLDQNTGRASAMQLAMISLIDSGKRSRSHPAYWAPFDLVGEGHK